MSIRRDLECSARRAGRHRTARRRRERPRSRSGSSRRSWSAVLRKGPSSRSTAWQGSEDLRAAHHDQVQDCDTDQSGDFGSSGWAVHARGGRIVLEHPGSAALPSQTVINGRFQRAKVTGTIKDPAFVTRSRDSTARSSTASSRRPTSRVPVMRSRRRDAGVGRLLGPEERLRERSTSPRLRRVPEEHAVPHWRVAPSASREPLVSLRTEPKRADADVTVTTLTFAGGTNDVMAWRAKPRRDASPPARLDARGGFATVIRYSSGCRPCSAKPRDLPAC